MDTWQESCDPEGWFHWMNLHCTRYSDRSVLLLDLTSDSGILVLCSCVATSGIKVENCCSRLAL